MTPMHYPGEEEDIKTPPPVSHRLGHISEDMKAHMPTEFLKLVSPRACLCPHACVRACGCACVRAGVHSLHVRACGCACICTYLRAGVRASACACVRVCAGLHVPAGGCACVCTCVRAGPGVPSQGRSRRLSAAEQARRGRQSRPDGARTALAGVPF